MAWAAVPPRAHRRSRLAAVRRVAAAVAVVAMFLLAVTILGSITGRWRLVPVLTGSMAPGYPAGSVVFVVPKPSSQLAVGDVVLFQAPVPGKPTVMHRLAAIEQADDGVVYRTKGDANAAADPWLLQLRGSTAWEVRGGPIPLLGRLTMLAKQPAVGASLLMLSVLTLMTAALRGIWGRPARAAAGAARAQP